MRQRLVGAVIVAVAPANAVVVPAAGASGRIVQEVTALAGTA
jgi:hypothetical protein